MSAQEYIDHELPLVAPGDAQGTTEVLRTALGMLRRNPGLRLLTREHLRIPHGTYTLTPDADGVCLRLGVPAVLDWQGSALLVPAGATGMLFEREGGWGICRDVTVASADFAQSPGVGIEVHCPMQSFSGLLLRGLGTGMRIDGVIGDGHNASHAHVINCRFFDNDVALHVRGGDANGCHFLGVDIWGGRVGLLDESFLGCAYHGLTLHSIREHAVKQITPNPSVFVGVLMEVDCGSDLPGGVHETLMTSPNSTWLGGNVISLIRAGDRVGQGWSRLGFREQQSPNHDRFEATIPHAAASAGIEVRRMSPAGSLKERFQLRWVDFLARFGIAQSTAQIPANGVTMPIGWSASGAFVDATAEAPLGIDVSAMHGEINQLKAELAQLRAALADEQQ